MCILLEWRREKQRNTGFALCPKLRGLMGPKHLGLLDHLTSYCADSIILHQKGKVTRAVFKDETWPHTVTAWSETDFITSRYKAMEKGDSEGAK